MSKEPLKVVGGQRAKGIQIPLADKDGLMGMLADNDGETVPCFTLQGFFLQTLTPLRDGT